MICNCWLTDWLTDWLIKWMSGWLVDKLLIDWLTDWMITGFTAHKRKCIITCLYSVDSSIKERYSYSAEEWQNLQNEICTLFIVLGIL